MTALLEARRLSVEFGTQLANHAAMVLHAQRRLGGTDADARRFMDAYVASTGLAPQKPSPGEVTRATWASHLGDRDFEAAHRAFFRAELVRAGSGQALAREWLPRLLPGMAASALHALMRLAYAVDAREDAEIAEALGYWSACYLSLGEGSGAPPVTADPVQVLLRVAAEPSLAKVKPNIDLLWHFMRDTAALPAFAPIHDMLEIRPDTLDRIADASLRVFARTGEFCALHAVTGTHWIRLILPLLGTADQHRAIRFFWQARIRGIDRPFGIRLGR
ncbi:questin oxidase family protein [Leptolyngbya sp. 15MV]|nr:questin oxidase family protein [Leptolyngbya sp. 15MV]